MRVLYAQRPPVARPGMEHALVELQARLGYGPGLELAGAMGWTEPDALELSPESSVLDMELGESVHARDMVPGRVYALPTELPSVDDRAFGAPGGSLPRRERRSLQRGREAAGLPAGEWTEAERERMARALSLALGAGSLPFTGELVCVDAKAYRANVRAQLRDDLRFQRPDRTSWALRGTELVPHDERPFVQRAVRRNPERLPLPGHLGHELPELPEELGDAMNTPPEVESVPLRVNALARGVAELALHEQECRAEEAERAERVARARDRIARKVRTPERPLPMPREIARKLHVPELPATGFPRVLAPMRFRSEELTGVRIVREDWKRIHLAFAGLPLTETRQLPAERIPTVYIRRAID